RLRLLRGLLLHRLPRKETEYCYSCLRPYIDLAVDHERRDEFVPIAKSVATPGGLVTVIELVLQVGGIVRVQNSWSCQRRFNSPNDPVLSAIRRDCGRRT